MVATRTEAQEEALKSTQLALAEETKAHAKTLESTPN